MPTINFPSLPVGGQAPAPTHWAMFLFVIYSQLAELTALQGTDVCCCVWGRDKHVLSSALITTFPTACVTAPGPCPSAGPPASLLQGGGGGALTPSHGPPVVGKSQPVTLVWPPAKFWVCHLASKAPLGGTKAPSRAGAAGGGPGGWPRTGGLGECWNCSQTGM